MSFKKYPKIEALGHEDNKDIFLYSEDEITVEEKVDGGNGSFWMEKDGLHLGTRNRDLVSDGDAKTFSKQRITLLKLLEGKKINPDYIYYIEWMQRHTINYTSAPDVIALDIRLKHLMDESIGGCGFFLNRKAKEIEFKRLGLELVPLIWQGKAKELRKKTLEDLISKSKYYDGTMEGIVIKNYSRKSNAGNHQIYAKIVTSNFKENNRAVFGSIKAADSDTLKIVDQFCTDARIRKKVLQQVNEFNQPLEMKLMAIVPSNVIKDIIIEEFDGIYSNYKFVDFSQMKRLVAKRCLSVIREEMSKEAIK